VDAADHGTGQDRTAQDPTAQHPTAQDPTALRKTALRDQLLTARRRRSLLDQQAAAAAVAERLLAWQPVRRAATVAAYASVGGEPATGLLLEQLLAAGKRVVLPVLQPDGDLDWAVYTGDLRAAGRGLLEPPGPRLGADAVATADVVLVPGLAVDRRGYRLGRGGGSYDRALGRVPPGTPVVALLHDEEVLDEVPVAAHDRPVTAVVTPSAVHLLR
jgi:5-formyltetrahydrofolate cyclo-ligase